MNKNDLESLIRQEPLLMEEISHAFIDWDSLLSTDNPSLFFGVGLCTSKEPAVAIPFDILSFFFVAEKLRRSLKLQTIFVLIADEHALTNNFMTDKIIRELRSHMLLTFTTIIHNLHLQNFQVITSSEIHRDPMFQETLSSIPPMTNEYLRKEIADMTWFTRVHNVRIKLGWTINNDITPHGHDERFFDTQIQKNHVLPLSFLHLKAGRTFDPKRPKASPYISVAHESRIVLTNNEDVEQQMNHVHMRCSDEVFRATRSHLALIVRLFESLFIRIPKRSLEEKIQFIIDLSTQG